MSIKKKMMFANHLQVLIKNPAKYFTGFFILNFEEFYKQVLESFYVD
jgi:hypothetical protein